MNNNARELRLQFLKASGLTSNDAYALIKKENMSNREIMQSKQNEKSISYIKATQPKDIQHFAIARLKNTSDLSQNLEHKRGMKILNDRLQKIVEEIRKPEVVKEIQARGQSISAESSRQELAQQFKDAKRYRPL